MSTETAGLSREMQAAHRLIGIASALRRHDALDKVGVFEDLAVALSNDDPDAAEARRDLADAVLGLDAQG